MLTDNIDIGATMISPTMPTSWYCRHLRLKSLLLIFYTYIGLVPHPLVKQESKINVKYNTCDVYVLGEVVVRSDFASPDVDCVSGP